ncbi:MAG: hypothetical protein E4H03_05255 [Myxococcales bacterium]|nr:MAG: hypothetical protein E4H03_05255 [Myxococcales bacterium]
MHGRRCLSAIGFALVMVANASLGAAAEVVDLVCEGPFPLATSTTTSSTIPTTSSSSSTTSLLTIFDARIDYAIFPEEPLTRSSIHVELDDQNFGVVETLDLGSCQSLAEGATVTHDGTDFLLDFTTMSGGKLDQAQTVLRCIRSSHPPEDPIDASWFGAAVRSVQTGRGQRRSGRALDECRQRGLQPRPLRRGCRRDRDRDRCADDPAASGRPRRRTALPRLL